MKKNRFSGHLAGAVVSGVMSIFVLDGASLAQQEQMGLSAEVAQELQSLSSEEAAALLDGSAITSIQGSRPQILMLQPRAEQQAEVPQLLLNAIENRMKGMSDEERIRYLVDNPGLLSALLVRPGDQDQQIDGGNDQTSRSTLDLFAPRGADGPAISSAELAQRLVELERSLRSIESRLDELEQGN